MSTEDSACQNGVVKQVYIGLGSNLEQPLLQLRKAMAALEDLPGTTVVADSGYYKSRPMGPTDQPDYINAVVELETTMSAPALLEQCQSIEKQQGRVKTRVWGERCIDLDILLYAQQQITTETLTVPHPGICKRDFVYMPLLKLDPEIDIPGWGRLRDILETAADKESDFACQFAGNIVR